MTAVILSRARFHSTVGIYRVASSNSLTTGRLFYTRGLPVYLSGGSSFWIRRHRSPLSSGDSFNRGYTDQPGPKSSTSTAFHRLWQLVLKSPRSRRYTQNILSVIPFISVFVLPVVFLAGLVLWTLETEFKIQILDELGVWLILDDVSGKHSRLGVDQPLKHGSAVYPQLEKDEIRLLILEPGRWDAPLECGLVCCKPSDDLPYEALSYAWGDTTRCHTIGCNGEPFGITANLESALRHLRHPYGRRVLWVDAICIDQDDDDERGRQVRLMKQIFSQAQRVIVWLGQETFDVRNVFPFRSLYGFVPGPEGVALGRSYDFTMDKMAAISLSDDDLRPLINLMERPWFRRLWILQEVAFAREVLLYCGKKRSRWETFAAILAQLKRKGVVLDRFTPKAAIGIDSALEIDEIRRGARQSLLSVLLATSSAECTDVRDKVFGVLGLAEDYENWSKNFDDDGSRTNILEPDYTVNVADVFLRLAQWSVEVYGVSDLLSCTSRTDVEPISKLRGLPSWVPDWTRLDVDTPFARCGYCRMLQEEPLFKSDEPVILEESSLKVPAVLLDEVKQVGRKPHFKKTPFGKLWEEEESKEPSKVILKVYTWTDENVVSIRGAHKWVSDCEELANLMKNRQTGRDVEILERAWRTMTAGMTGDGEAITDGFAHSFRTYRDFLEACLSAHKLGSTDIMVPRSHVDAVARVEAALNMWSSKRRFAITQEGRMALVPNRAQEGDLIILVANSKVPHIVRRKGDGTFAIVGEAYLEDMKSCSLAIDDAASDGGADPPPRRYKVSYYCIT
ncbi:heterokaryon incompatibility protein-domain-containing protein [Xylariaceae sp. FL0662B]|nr:heterokaryon incompatibility protein-domain-containing protein [Xylariaceae sp. FL0662B]